MLLGYKNIFQHFPHWEHQRVQSDNATSWCSTRWSRVSELRWTTIKAFLNPIQMNMDVRFSFSYVLVMSCYYKTLHFLATLSHCNAFSSSLEGRSERRWPLWRSKVNMQAFKKKTCGCKNTQRGTFLWERELWFQLTQLKHTWEHRSNTHHWRCLRIQYFKIY